MKRRNLVGLIAAALAAPASLLAQPARSAPRIGVLHAGAENSEVGRLGKQLMRDVLRRVGFDEGSNFIIEWRWAEGKLERLPVLAAELVRLKVDLIVAYGSNEAAAAAKRSTRTIPIVMHAVTTPVESDLIDSLARPGGNVTGTSWAGVEIVEKLFQLLREAMPGAFRIAVMRNPTTRDARLYMDAYERAASALGMTLQYFFVTRPEEVAAALDRIAASQSDALFVANNPVITPRYSDIVTFAVTRRLFSVGTSPDFVDQGGLFCYSPDRVHLAGRTASYVERILRGAKPADLPVELPTKYELVINAKTARAIGYKVPQSLLLRADRVIE
jgi:putative ABC transport system substrate-binding protein